MNRRAIFCTALVMACAPYAASAQGADLSPGYTACMDKAGSTSSMIECTTTEFQQQDARLNKAYKAVMSNLPPPRKKQLQKAQRAWIAFRDANCGFYADPDGGTLARVSGNDCMMNATAARARELEGFKQ